MRSSFSAVCFFIFFPLFSAAQDSTIAAIKRTYVAMPLQQELTIDGALNDEGWSVSEWTGDFIALRPDENTPPTYKSKFKILYDAKNLYVGVRFYDPDPSKIEKRLSRLDGFAGDYAELHIDGYNDKRSAFSFTVTSAGVKGDEFISQNGDNFDESWNPIWYTATTIDEEEFGWSNTGSKDEQYLSN